MPERTMERFALKNGLRVTVAPDRSTPLVGVAVVYDVGFRSEPEGRTGFAHLFEHLMFQGSANVGKAEHPRLIQGAGGVFNGTTRADVTSYYETLPSGGLELALFLEADRMGAPAVTEENLRNQVSVVEEEIKVNVLNQPYGGFPWLVLPALAFDTYPNAHDGYGDFSHLEAATLGDARDFHARYYSPSNAVLVVAGDCNPDEVHSLAERHFGSIESQPLRQQGPWHEPPLASARRRVIDDPLAPQPAFALGYRTPDPISGFARFLPYYVAATVLSDGDASRLRARLVHRDRLVTDISCDLGTFGGLDALAMRDPVLFRITAHHPGRATTDQLVAVIEEELGRLADEGPSDDELERSAVGMTSGLWRALDSVLELSTTLAAVEVIHGRQDLIDELPSLVAGLSAADVAAAAADLASQHTALVEIHPSAAGNGR